MVPILPLLGAIAAAVLLGLAVSGPVPPRAPPRPPPTRRRPMPPALPTSGRPRALDPLAGRGRLTSRYGPRVHPITGEKHVHQGVDWAAPTGTPVYAAVGGLVERVDVAGDGKRDANGNAVVIRTTGGDRWLYLHLDSVTVPAGAQLDAGDQLGTVGNTGRSKGAHLHLQVYVAGKTVDPLTFFA